jgi:uncharacterized protein (DUF302 family)
MPISAQALHTESITIVQLFDGNHVDVVHVGVNFQCSRPFRSRAMADSTVTRQVLRVEHIKMQTAKKFADVEAALERNVSQLDPAIVQALANGDEQRAAELERGAPLFIFLKRDHGALLRVVGQPRKVLQYEIGNPHTASKMTRHRLPAGLYAPLRVILYEDEKGGSVFEYDKPSSLFGQFEDEQVSAVARGLDAALEQVLRRAVV